MGREQGRTSTQQRESYHNLSTARVCIAFDEVIESLNKSGEELSAVLLIV